MQSPKEMLKEPLGFMRTMATKKVIQQFAHKFELVYFGFVDPREDKHELVRGITLSPEHKDTHYTVGNFRNHDITLVERQTNLHFPGKPPHMYRWLIMQIDLKHGGFPHIFIDANHHEEVFYANFFLQYAHFEDASSLFSRHDPLFSKYFKVFAERQAFDEVWSVIKSDMTAMLAYHFHQFDYELDDDRLCVYASNTVITTHLLQEMMRIGLWLADYLNAQPSNSTQ